MRINPDPDGDRRAEALRRIKSPSPAPKARSKAAKGPRAPARWRRWVWGALALWCCLTLGPVLAYRVVDPPLTTFMLAEWLGARLEGRWTFRIQYSPVPLAQIALPMRAAVVAAEDQRFMRHHGFDFEAINAALSASERAGRPPRGASTISQQVAKNLFLWSGRSWFRKGLEAWFTVLIEVCWSKQRILEVYLNVAQFGEGIYGVEAASRLLFATTAADLGSGDAALLAAVLPNPVKFRADAPSDYVRGRQRWILRQMGQ